MDAAQRGALQAGERWSTRFGLCLLSALCLQGVHAGGAVVIEKRGNHYGAHHHRDWPGGHAGCPNVRQLGSNSGTNAGAFRMFPGFHDRGIRRA
jgi:hypothetical protein